MAECPWRLRTTNILPPNLVLKSTGEAWWTIPFLEWWRISKAGWLIILTQLSIILFFTGWVYQEVQYNSYFQAYFNSVSPLVTAVLIVVLAIAAAPAISILRRRTRRTQQARQTTIRPKVMTRTQPSTRTRPTVSKHVPKPADRPRRPGATAVKPVRVMPTVQIPRFILEPPASETKEKTTKTGTTPDTPHFRDKANHRSPK